SQYTLSHLPTHLCKTEDCSKLETLLTDLSFIEAKCAAGMTFGLVADYQAVLMATNIKKDWPGRGKIVEFGRFLQGQAYKLAVYPSLMFQQATNQPDDSAPARATIELQDTE